jgi:hypothetical protein
MPSTTLVHAIHEVGYELMLVGARVTDNATAEIIKDTGKLLTISIPGGLLPVHLTVDPPGAARKHSAGIRECSVCGGVV